MMGRAYDFPYQLGGGSRRLGDQAILLKFICILKEMNPPSIKHVSPLKHPVSKYKIYTKMLYTPLQIVVF